MFVNEAGSGHRPFRLTVVPEHESGRRLGGSAASADESPPPAECRSGSRPPDLSPGPAGIRRAERSFCCCGSILWCSPLPQHVPPIPNTYDGCLHPRFLGLMAATGASVRGCDGGQPPVTVTVKHLDDVSGS